MASLRRRSAGAWRGRARHQAANPEGRTRAVGGARQDGRAAALDCGRRDHGRFCRQPRVRAARVVRAMPNTPGAIGQGHHRSLCRVQTLSQADRALAETLMAALGETLWVQRRSADGRGHRGIGLGPGLCVSAGRGAGRSGSRARLGCRRPPIASRAPPFPAQVRCSTRMRVPASDLRREVTSPGGTTEAALAGADGRRRSGGADAPRHRCCHQTRQRIGQVAVEKPTTRAIVLRSDKSRAGARCFPPSCVSGLTSFGGPVAHLGYFRHEFVEKRRWLDETAYADIVALCQFLPGPASSETGIALGLMRAGLPGAFAAWLGFTVPSAIAHDPCRLWRCRLPRRRGRSPIARLEDRGGRGRGSSRHRHGAHAHVPIGHARRWRSAPRRWRCSLPTTLGQIVAIAAGAVDRLGCSCQVWRRAGAGASGAPAAKRWSMPALILFFALLHRLVAGRVATGVTRLRVIDSFLPLGRAGVRRRSCRPAAAAGRGRAAGMGEQRRLSRRLWRGASVARAACSPSRPISARSWGRRPMAGSEDCSV